MHGKENTRGEISRPKIIHGLDNSRRGVGSPKKVQGWTNLEWPALS